MCPSVPSLAARWHSACTAAFSDAHHRPGGQPPPPPWPSRAHWTAFSVHQAETRKPQANGETEVGEGLLGRSRKGTLQWGRGLEPPDGSVTSTSVPGCSEAERHGLPWRAGSHGPLSAGLVLREKRAQRRSTWCRAASGGAGPERRATSRTRWGGGVKGL